MKIAKLMASSSPVLHVGIGEARQVDQIRVLWPDGSREVFVGVAADQLVQLNKGAGNATDGS